MGNMGNMENMENMWVDMGHMRTFDDMTGNIGYAAHVYSID